MGIKIWLLKNLTVVATLARAKIYRLQDTAFRNYLPAGLKSIPKIKISSFFTLLLYNQTYTHTHVHGFTCSDIIYDLFETI